ncbi:MAG: extracellular solute-binding protein [Lachnospiraceae bacterium]|nr:extracellular solute-binding protein [Lachnospiraceae bacterium]
MKTNGKRWIALFLALVMIVGMTACGKKEKENQENASAPGGQDAAANAEEMKQYVYKEEKLSLPEDVNPETISEMHKVGDSIYVSGMSYGERPLYAVYRLAEDGQLQDSSEIALKENEDIGRVCFDEDGNLYGIRTRYAWEVMDEEVIGEEEMGDEAESMEQAVPVETPQEADPDTVTEEEPETEEAETEETEASAEELIADEEMGFSSDEAFLVKYTPDGTEQYAVKLNGDENGAEGGSYWYANGIHYTPDGIVVSSYEDIRIYDPETGEEKNKVTMPDNLTADYVIQTKDGKIVIGGYNYNQAAETGNFVFKELDTTTGKLDKDITLTSGMAWRYNFFPGANKDLIMTDDSGIYEADLGGEPVKLMDFVASDVLADGFMSLVPVGEGKFLTMGSNPETGERQLFTYTKVDPSTIKDKIPLTMACYYLGWRTKNMVVDFNKSNDTYRINIVDYSIYDSEADYNAGMTRFNADIASGNIPDLLELSTNMPVDSYMSKGLFEDLAPYMEKDAELSGNKYLTNVFDAFNPEGKMYQIIPSFSVTTLVGKSSIFGKEPGITVAELEKLRSEFNIDYKYLMGPSNREMAFYLLLVYGNNSFVDWKSGKCDFDNEEFINLLDFIGRFPKELNESDWEEDTQSFYRNGRSLVENAYFSGYQDYTMDRYGTFGEEITFVGYPNGGKEDYSGSLINSYRRFAMGSTSANKEGAWEFLRTYLTKDYQDKVAEQEGNFPVLESALEELEKKAQEKPYYTDEDGKKVEYDNTWWVDGQEIKIEPLSKEEAAAFTGYLKSLTHAMSFDENIMNIIQEEMGPVLEGQKPASEAARIIQSRVSIYINENS